MLGVSVVFFVFFAIFWVVSMLIGIAGFVVWIIMLIDIFKRTNWETQDDRTLWIILVLILGGPAAIAYYFIIYKKLGKAV